jgi:hypothetical protein
MDVADLVLVIVDAYIADGLKCEHR